MHCHASVYVPYKKLGNGDLIRGFELMNQMPYSEARKLVEHPVACIDCHEPTTMALRVTRPGFLEGIKAYKASQGIANYDVNTMATRQEMRTYVCGQCHVEYHFKGPEKRLTYPWSKGIRVEEIYAYYEETGFSDWTHGLTGAKALKAQHPEFEMFSQGIHARSGVACADCHMPYKREGALKISDHHVRSPLLNVNRACQTCHRWDEAELRQRAESIQTRTTEVRNLAMDAVVQLIGDIEHAVTLGKRGAELEGARKAQRKAQFFLDFVEAENSTGFHAPQEAGRILANAIDIARSGQIALRDSVGALPPPGDAAPTAGATAGTPAAASAPVASAPRAPAVAPVPSAPVVPTPPTAASTGVQQQPAPMPKAPEPKPAVQPRPAPKAPADNPY
jgi:nitrite reductase (cytochrome c-552)